MDHRNRPRLALLAAPVVVLLPALLSGCASVASSAASGLAENLSAAILNQDDPDLVRDGTPAYLLLLDTLVQSAPDDPEILGAAAQLYAAYGTAFVDDAARARRLTERARDYGARSLCAADSDACRLEGIRFEEYEAAISGVGVNAADALYSYCVGSLSFIRANSDDWNALADLAKVEAALNHLLTLNPTERAANIYLYLGILNSLRPPALGGQPERGREYFEKALDLTAGADLAVKVEYARGYARLVYDRALHDRLLREVLAADAKRPGLTLFNSLAKRQAAELLATADDYF